MLLSKSKKLFFPFFILGGFIYFTAFSSWEINFIFKNYVVLIPLQILALIYVFLIFKKQKNHNHF